MKLKRIILSDLLFFIVVILLGILSFFSYQRIISLNEQADWVNHTNMIKLKLEQTLSHIRDAETRQRFYLLTNDSSYLLFFPEVMRQNEENIANLDSLTIDNEIQKSNLKILKILTKKRLQRLNIVLKSPAQQQVNMGKLLVEGKTLMNEIETTIEKMLQIENRLLAERSSKKDYAATITPLYSLELSVFAIMIVVVAYYMLRSETRLRFHAEGNMKKINDYFKDLPALFAIVKGPEHVYDLANTLYHDISGNRELSGRSFRQAFPELKGQQFYELLDGVYSSAKVFIGKEMPLTLNRGGGNLTKGYFNFILQPIFNEQNNTEGILIFGYEITEMIETRNKVAEMEQRSRLAIEAANMATFDWNLENNSFDSSSRLLKIFGYSDTDEHVTHKDLLNRFHPADKPIRDAAVADAAVKGSLAYEARVIWPDKSIHWVSVYGKIIHDDFKEVSRMYGTALDITEQKSTLEILRESEAKFRLLADSMPQFIWTGDNQGNLDYFNKAVFDFSGLTPDNIQQKGWISIVHPDEQQENIKKWIAAVTTGEEFIFEHRFRNYKGEYRWQLSRALPQRDETGKIQRWVGTSTDIQDQKNRSQKLEEKIKERTLELSELNKYLLIKNNIFAQAEENALIGSYSWNLQTGELEYSDHLFRLFGYEPNEFVPSFEKYYSMIHPEDKDKVTKEIMQTMETSNLTARTYRIITKNGTVKHFRSSAKIMGEAENVMLIGTVQDVSQDTLLNEILRIKNLQLERSNAELESFNFIASHDLQEPLRKIQAFSQRIIQKEGDNFSAFSQDYFSRINSSASRMQNLINALLSYSRADATVKEVAPVDLNILIKNVQTDLQELIDDKKAIIEFSGLPTFNAIRLQVHQLFVNLLSNAIKYSKTDLVPHIQIKSATVKGNEINDPTADINMTYLKITVTDNGIGFEQEYEQKIFELFQRLHSSEDYTGTGIGLAICKKIMRNHQGFISAKGQVGIGAVFSIYFPVAT